MIEPYETTLRRGGALALQEASKFFMQADPVFATLKGIADRLGELGVPYAVAGGMALVAHGYRRTTEDVDILVTPENLARIHQRLVGLGYLPLFAKSKNLRDTATGVRVEFIVSGQYPGDGRPKPVAFPDPAQVAVDIDGVAYVSLTTLVELKLASGMTNPGRLRDLADVQDLTLALHLTPEFADQLHPYVQQKFRELAASGAGSSPEEPG